MYQVATSILTLISLAGHVLLGCCAHHAHPACNAPAAVSAAEEHRQADGAGHAHARHAHSCGCPSHAGPHPSPAAPDCGDPADGCGSHEHDEAPCDGRVCHYLGPDVVKAPDASVSAATDNLIAAADDTAAAACASLRDCVDSDASAAGFRDGARIHELMAVWLL